MTEANRSPPAPPRPRASIGLYLGDLIFDADGLNGDGASLAAVALPACSSTSLSRNRALQ